MSEVGYKFKPQESITPYEIALLLVAEWQYQIIPRSFVESFPENVQRHFEKLEDQNA